MEKKIFNWEAWDQMDTFDFCFYDCTLVRKIGEFNTGDKFAFANLSYDSGVLELYKEKIDETPVGAWNLDFIFERKELE